MAPHEHVVDEDGVVRIGSIVFALIRPTEGSEIAFNHWYERDHYYTAGLAAPGVFSAGRFVEPDAGLHLALYYVLPGLDAARVEFATDQVATAVMEDRLFVDREHLHTWSYEPIHSWRRDPGGVPPALALDHRYPAAKVSMFDGLDAIDALDRVVDDPEIDLAIALRPLTRIMPSAWDGGGDLPKRTTVVGFHRAPTPHTAPHGSVWSGSFLPMVFGTDTHLPG